MVFASNAQVAPSFGLGWLNDTEVSPVERLRVTAGLRWDRLSYRFDNRIDQAV